jgi:hypothetical protein
MYNLSAVKHKDKSKGHRERSDENKRLQTSCSKGLRSGWLNAIVSQKEGTADICLTKRNVAELYSVQLILPRKSITHLL